MATAAMSVVYVLTTPILEDGENATMEINHNEESGKIMTILGHVHFKRMQDMSKDGLILAFDMDTEKIDLCDLHATISLGNKKYFVTFIDDGYRLPDLKLKTLGERDIECIFVGYVEHSKAFRFYVIEPNETVSINSIIESRDAIFNKNKFSPVSRPSLSIPKGTENISGSVVPEDVTNEIFKRKLKVDGTIKKFKARLVIQGFKQKSGIDYFDTYAPVAHISTIRLLIAMALIHNLIIHQIDVKIAFLNGDLDEEVDLAKEFLSSRFYMKDMREAHVILGIRIKYESNRIEISQSHFIEKASKKQTCITGSTMKYEFVALAADSKEAEWLKNLLLKISLWSKPIAPISIRWIVLL
ncbi:zinc finger, CCHC-type containing protein [Tanacetum coccineum]